MTALLGRFVKQSSEVLDYDVDYTDWFSNRQDSAASFEVTAQAGITVEATSRSGNVVKTVLGGGTDGESYKLTVLLTTTAGLVKEADFIVRIKDV